MPLTATKILASDLRENALPTRPGGMGPGLAVPIAVTVATANPVGLIISGAAKIEGDTNGRTTIEGTGKRTADAIAGRMKTRFEQEGWI